MLRYSKLSSYHAPYAITCNSLADSISSQRGISSSRWCWTAWQLVQSCAIRSMMRTPPLRREVLILPSSSIISDSIPSRCRESNRITGIGSISPPSPMRSPAISKALKAKADMPTNINPAITAAAHVCRCLSTDMSSRIRTCARRWRISHAWKSDTIPLALIGSRGRGRPQGSWSRGYDVAFTWRRSQVQFLPSPPRNMN